MRYQLASHLGNRAVRLVDIATQRLYRLTGGRIGHRQMGLRFLLLTTIGRKTGRSRVHALLYLPAGDDLVIVASNNGGDTHPAWYFNLCAQPRVSVQVGRRKGVYLARTASPGERRDLWPKLVAYHSPYRHHQEQTQRQIPVVILSPVTGGTPV